MHTLGKVLMFFVIVGALGGTYLGARLLDTRSRWMQQVGDKASQFEENQRRLAEARRRVDSLEQDVNRLTFGFGRYWIAPNSGPVQGATVQLGIGSQAGLAARDVAAGQVPRVHLFHLDDEGGSTYLGLFELDTVQADRAGATLTRDIYPGETLAWQAGTYRVRSAVPSPWTEEFDHLWSEWGVAVQANDSRQVRLDLQLNNLQQAQTELDSRMWELQGNPNAPPNADLVETVGVVEAMRLAEISRDAVLEQLDQLRREYSAKWHALQTVLEQNRQRRLLLQQSPSVISQSP